jgi:hypothetical protein
LQNGQLICTAAKDLSAFGKILLTLRLTTIIMVTGGDLGMAKMGRPKADNPRNRSVTVRMTPEQYEELLSYSQKHDQTVTQTIVQGVYLLISSNREKEAEA